MKSKTWIPKAMCKAMDLDHAGHPLELARTAIDENPSNKPSIPPEVDVTPLQVALMTSKWWHSDKTTFTFAFMDTPKPGVPARIAQFANAWNKPSILNFVYTQDVNAADFRIRFQNDGYWSYIGTDCKSIPKNQHTMNLQGMNSTTFSDKEGMRVIPHEFFHGVGSPHEHSRPSIVARLDPAKTIKVFQRDQGWTPTMIQQQILTPINESAIFGTTPDETSIMCYWFTGECTKDGKPIVGGFDLSDLDKEFAGKIWPRVGPVEPPPIGVVTGSSIVAMSDGTKLNITISRAG